MSRLLRRAGHGLVLVFAVSVLSFVIVAAAPGDFFADMRLDPRVSEATVRAMRARHGLDRPLPERYAKLTSKNGRASTGKRVLSRVARSSLRPRKK